MIFQGVDVSGSFDITGSFIAPKGAAFPLTASSVQGDMFFHTTFDTLYVFTTSGSWTPVGNITSSIPPQASTNIEYLVTAGGGGGGSYGGGGAGGYLSSSIDSVTSGSTYTITLGAGGAGSGNSYTTEGTAGTNSSIAGSTISTITPVGGGGGGDNEDGADDGGSGGGGSDGPTDASGGSGTAGQGNDGGDGSYSDPHYMGGGGGGAGAVGGDGVSTGTRTSGAGGAGLASKITGQGRFRAGGGGGVRYNTTGTIGAGGAGGGGNGGTWNGSTSAISSATAGTENSGSGGGAGQNGGKGVAIFAYDSGSFSGTGGIKSAREDGYVVHTFNSSGTLAIASPTDFPVIPAENFNILTWTGNDSNDRDITGLGFKPDWVWIKRSNSSEPHAIYDVLRGVNKQLSSDSDLAQATNAGSYLGMSSFDSDGFNVGNNGGTNRSGNTYVGWCWKAGGTGVSNGDGNITSTVSVNQAAGFSIVKYTGNNSATMTVGHGLSQAPQLVITKRTDADQDWGVYTNAITGDGTTNWFSLNDADAAGSGNYLSVTNQVLSATQTGGFWMQGEQIAYCFHDIAGYQKIGTYTGTNSSNTINVGFKPKFLLIKGNTNSTNWTIVDNQRDNADEWLYANAADGTYDDSNTYTAFTTNGFTVDTTASYVNSSGVAYIYLAISE